MPEPTLLTAQNNYRCFVCTVVTAPDSRAHAYKTSHPRLHTSVLSTAADKEKRPHPIRNWCWAPAAAETRLCFFWENEGTREIGCVSLTKTPFTLTSDSWKCSLVNATSSTETGHPQCCQSPQPSGLGFYSEEHWDSNKLQDSNQKGSQKHSKAPFWKLDVKSGAVF